jgi:hypothetical protein
MRIKKGKYYTHILDNDIVLVHDVRLDAIEIEIIIDTRNTWGNIINDKYRTWSDVDDFLKSYKLNKVYNSPLYKVLNE